MSMKLLINVLKHVREKRAIMESCLVVDEAVINEFIQVIQLIRNRQRMQDTVDRMHRES